VAKTKGGQINFSYCNGELIDIGDGINDDE
jgi:hypothetical protein